eukprot:2112891-Rhodomonas_salina.3
MKSFNLVSALIFRILLYVVSAQEAKDRGNGPIFRMPQHRNDIGTSMDELDSRVGVELGVQEGKFAQKILERWGRCSRFYLVDLWQRQEESENYRDTANVPNPQQLKNLASARIHVGNYLHRTKAIFLPMSTVDAAKLLMDASVDFIYVDARHDYCGVLEDIEAWWPKLRAGGVMAGHDFLTAEEASSLVPGSDWGLCANGSWHAGAVKGAVSDFAERKGLHVQATEEDFPQSWAIRKPFALVAEQRWAHNTRRNAKGEKDIVPFPILHHLAELGLGLDQFGGLVGGILGARNGQLAGSILDSWAACTDLYLVDEWQNLDDLAAARTVVGRYAGRTKTIFLPMSTTDASELLADASVDFLFVDARHDYCRMTTDMETWWPKLRSGGIMA